MTTSNSGCLPFTVGTDTVLIQNQSPDLFDFAIVSETDSATCTRVTEPIRWKVADLSRDMVVTGPGGLRKIQGALWDGGAFSWNRVFRNGYFEFTALETNKARMIGLSSSNPNNGYTTIQYAIYLKSNSTYEIRQSGATINVPSPNFAAGDAFRIFWDNNEIKYYKNAYLPCKGHRNRCLFFYAFVHDVKPKRRNMRQYHHAGITGWHLHGMIVMT
mgnify:CR=1 FL=1